MKRRDGRSDDQLRQLALETGPLSRADGSAKFTCGPVTVMAAVSGPVEVRLRDEIVDKAALEINIKPIRGLAGPASKALAESLHILLLPILLLNRHPRSLIQLSLQTLSLPSTRYAKPFKSFQENTSIEAEDTSEGDLDLEDSSDGNQQIESVTEKAAAINAAISALIDSGIGMKGTVTSVGIAFLPVVNRDEDEIDKESEPPSIRIVLDPTADHERDAQATLCVAFSYGLNMGGAEGDMCYLDMSKGYCDEDHLTAAIDLARRACKATYSFIRQTQEARYA